MTRSRANAGTRRPHPGGRPKKPKHERRDEQIAIRIEPELSKRLKAYVAALKQREPDVPWTKGSAIRRLMRAALDAQGIAGRT